MHYSLHIDGYSSWAYNQPNNFDEYHEKGYQSCATLDTRINKNKLNDQQCSNSYQYICENTSRLRIMDIIKSFRRNAFMCLSRFFSSSFFSTGSFPDDNLRKPKPIVFKFLSVIDLGHGKISIFFSGGGVFFPTPSNLE